jgi:low affinity Fe/Cu permease
MQIKLDELIRAVHGAQNRMVDLENLGEEELDKYKARFAELAARSRARGSGETEPVDLPPAAKEATKR